MLLVLLLATTLRPAVPADLADAHLVTTVECGEWDLRSFDRLGGESGLAIVRYRNREPIDVTSFVAGAADWIFLGARFVDAQHLIAFSRSLNGTVTPFSSADCGAHWTEGHSISPRARDLELTIEGTDLLVTSFEWEMIDGPPANLRQRLWLEPRKQHSVQGTRLFTSHDFGVSWTTEFPSRARAPMPPTTDGLY